MRDIYIGNDQPSPSREDQITKRICPSASQWTRLRAGEPFDLVFPPITPRSRKPENRIQNLR